MPPLRGINQQTTRSLRNRLQSTSLVQLEDGASAQRLLRASPSAEALNPKP